MKAFFESTTSIHLLALLLGIGLLPMSSIPVHAQNAGAGIAGTWEGKLTTPNGSLRIVFHITAEADSLSATLDSPDQAVRGIPVSEAHFTENTITMEVARIMGTYTGTVAADNQTIEGEWKQAGMTFPLHLSKTDKPSTPNRPQEPQEPYPYKAENVYFDNEQDDVRLAGTLTIPSTAGPHPAVVLVSGSGPQNRNEELMDHKPFLVLADHLTRQGIAVLRYDDRGTAESTGNFATATTEDLALDAQAAVDFLKSRSDISTIGVAGHSEGGLIAPMLAVEEGNIDFIVMLAGPGLAGHEILRLQGALVGRASGMSESLVQEMTRINGRLYDAAMGAPDGEVESRLKQVIAEIRENTDAGTLTALGLTPEYEPQMIQQLSSPWFQYFLSYDPAPVLQKVKVPVLSIIGSKDLQVPAEENTRSIKAALETAENPNFEAQILPDLNHLFQTATTGAITEYAQIEETFAPAALNLVSNWILSVVAE